jgi:hypothetical protein
VTGDLVEHERLLGRRSAITPEDSSYFMAETLLRLDGERVAVNFRLLFLEGDTTQDVTLRNFDRIVVPPISKTVYVFGQVVSPGHVPWVPNESVEYYIRQAGGYTNEARTGDTRIIKGAEGVWLDPDETTIEDGDGLWTPKEIHYPFSHYMTVYGQLAGIIATVISLGVLIANTK